MSVRSLCAALCGAVLLAIVGTTPAAACSCNGQYILKYGNNFERRIPTSTFSANHLRGNLQTGNACRRDARDETHACMRAIWNDRFNRDRLPNECRGDLANGNPRFRGAALPSDIKLAIERSACCQPSDLGDQWDVDVKVYTRSSGGRGCGPRLERSTTRHLVDYGLDCLAIRDRENRAGRFCGRIVRTEATRYDRPGSDLNHLDQTSSWQSCRNHCRERNGCRSWTWLPVAHQFGGCWLKGSIPWAKRFVLQGTAQMVSGTIASPE